MLNNKVVFISGASSGIGYSTAVLLAKQGFKVYAGARRIEKMESLKKYGISALYLDVTDNSSCINAIQSIINNEGKIDVLINNAGYGLFGAIEDTSLEQAKNQFEVNLFGLANLSKLTIPYMKKHKFGKIINISSMGGRFVSPFGGWYHASKYAVEAVSDALRMELSQFNIQVILVEPGIIKTNWDNIAFNNLIKTSQGGDYENFANKITENFKKIYNHKFATNPEIVAKVILNVINSEKVKSRYLVGFLSNILVFLHNILPEKIFDLVIKGDYFL